MIGRKGEGSHIIKLKRTFTLAGVVLLGGLFVFAIVLTVTGAPKSHLVAVIFSMVFILIVMFSIGLMTRVLEPFDPPEPLNGPDGESKQEEDLTIE